MSDGVERYRVLNIKGFTEWLVFEHKYLPADPIDKRDAG